MSSYVSRRAARHARERRAEFYAICALVVLATVLGIFVASMCGLALVVSGAALVKALPVIAAGGIFAALVFLLVSVSIASE